MLYHSCSHSAEAQGKYLSLTYKRKKRREEKRREEKRELTSDP
jgi:hypothetical protein